MTSVVFFGEVMTTCWNNIVSMIVFSCLLSGCGRSVASGDCHPSKKGCVVGGSKNQSKGMNQWSERVIDHPLQEMNDK